jgi:dimethylglycine catabolism A
MLAAKGGSRSLTYDGDVRVIEDLALLTYATPRVPDDDLAAPLRAAGITVVAVGDIRAPQEMLFATASGHAAGEAV